MKKLQRHIPATLTVSAVLCALTAAVFFAVGIWTPVWSDSWNCGDSTCFEYHGDGRWFHMAWLFIAIAVACGIGRIVMWRIDEEDNHGH